MNFPESLIPPSIAEARNPLEQRSQPARLPRIITIGLLGSIAALAYWGYSTSITALVQAEKISQQRAMAAALVTNPPEINPNLVASSRRGVLSNTAGTEVLEGGYLQKACSVTILRATPHDADNDPTTPDVALTTVLSSEHCFDKADTLVIRDLDGHLMRGQILNTKSLTDQKYLDNQEVDDAMLAMVKFSSITRILPLARGLPLGVLDQKQLGQTLETCGYPNALEGQQLCQDTTYLGNERGYYLLKMVMTVGNSGEPVLDEAGHIICTLFGSNLTRDDGISYCSPITPSEVEPLSQILQETLSPAPKNLETFR